MNRFACCSLPGTQTSRKWFFYGCLPTPIWPGNIYNPKESLKNVSDVAGKQKKVIEQRQIKRIVSLVAGIENENFSCLDFMSFSSGLLTLSFGTCFITQNHRQLCKIAPAIIIIQTPILMRSHLLRKLEGHSSFQHLGNHFTWSQGKKYHSAS